LNGKQEVVSQFGLLEDPTSLVLGPHGEIFVTDGNPDGPESPALLLRTDPHTGKQSVVSRGGFLRYPGGIAMLNESTVLVADAAAVKSSPRIVLLRHEIAHVTSKTTTKPLQSAKKRPNTLNDARLSY
jgi:hypothetical protein